MHYCWHLKTSYQCVWVHGKQMLWDSFPIISHLGRLQASDRFLRLFSLTTRDMFLIEYRYHGTKWYLVFTCPPQLYSLACWVILKLWHPSFYLLLCFLTLGGGGMRRGEFQTFMNSLIKAPPSECRLKVPAPESSKPMNIYTENQQMNIL